MAVPIVRPGHWAIQGSGSREAASSVVPAKRMSSWQFELKSQLLKGDFWLLLINEKQRFQVGGEQSFLWPHARFCTLLLSCLYVFEKTERIIIISFWGAPIFRFDRNVQG